jgi:hypothetical protein
VGWGWRVPLPLTVACWVCPLQRFDTWDGAMFVVFYVVCELVPSSLILKYLHRRPPPVFHHRSTHGINADLGTRRLGMPDGSGVWAVWRGVRATACPHPPHEASKRPHAVPGSGSVCNSD